MTSLHNLIYGGAAEDEETPNRNAPEDTLSQEPSDFSTQQPKSPQEGNRDESQPQPQIEPQTTFLSSSSPLLAATYEEQQNAVAPTVERLNILYNSTQQTDVSRIPASWNPAVREPKPPKVYYAQRPSYRNPQGVVEDPATTELREARKARRREWQDIRKNWKRRKLDLQSEIDIGGVIERTVKSAMEQQEEQQQQEEMKDTVMKQEVEHPVDEVVDTSDEEEADVLQQLTQASQQAEMEMQQTLKKDEDKLKESAFTPYSEQMEYQERGLVRPDDGTAKRDFLQMQKDAAPSPLLSRKRVEPNPVGEAITLQRLTVRTRTAPLKSCLPQMGHMMYTTPAFTHKRHVQRLAARYIVGAGPLARKTMALRLVRYLWDSDLWSARNGYIIRILAAKTADRHLEFWKRTWKNRHTVAKELGVTQHLQVTGPLVGYSLERMPLEFLPNYFKALERKQGVEKIVSGFGPKVDKACKGVDLIPTSTWTYLPGTAPPVPQHPLDETGVVFGAPDRFFMHLSHKCSIDEPTWRLTCSALLGTYADAIRDNDNSAMKETRNQLQMMGLQAIKQNKGLAIRATNSTAQSDWPLPHVYKSWMALLSINISVLLQIPERGRTSRIKPENNLDFERIKDEDLDTNDPSIAYDSLKDMSRDLFQEYDSQIKATPGLERFGDLHILRGILRFAKELPEKASRYFARPTNDTPLIQMRSLLEYMETKQLILEKPNKKAISVHQLEYALFQASQIFGQCVERDPTALQYHCWHLATLSCSLLLCSGNEIGSKAHVKPASLQGNANSELFVNHEQIPYQTRKMLPKFESIRQEVARSLYLLLQLASMQTHQDKLGLSSGYHNAVISFLEWKQVVGLLIGPRNFMQRVVTIQTIYNYHARILSLSLVGNSQDLANHCCERQTRIEGAARALERDPSQEANWRTLALELGPLGSEISKTGIDSDRVCKDRECFACWILSPGRYIDHEKAEVRHRSPAWWGRYRKGWWRMSVLDLTFHPKYKLPKVYQKPVYTSMAAELDDVLVLKSFSNDVASEDKPSINDCYEELLYLEAVAPNSVNECIDHLLPPEPPPDNSQDTVKPNDENTSCYLPFPTSDDPLKNRSRKILEVTCYKIIIAAHLYGCDRKWVRENVLDVTLKAWDDGQKKVIRDVDELCAVKWLYQMGISAVHALKIAFFQYNRKKLKSKIG